MTEDTDDNFEETEGICDDCNGPMQSVRDNIWYCPHCEIFLEWRGCYNVIVDEDIAEKLEAELGGQHNA